MKIVYIFPYIFNRIEFHCYCYIKIYFFDTIQIQTTLSIVFVHCHRCCTFRCHYRYCYLFYLFIHRSICLDEDMNNWNYLFFYIGLWDTPVFDKNFFFFFSIIIFTYFHICLLNFIHFHNYIFHWCCYFYLFRFRESY